MNANLESFACGNLINAKFCLEGYTDDRVNGGTYTCSGDKVAFEASAGEVQAGGLDDKNLP